MEVIEDEEELRKSYNCVKWSTFGITVGIIGIAAFYFLIIGLGYGANVVLWGKSHNMTNGECFPNQSKTCLNGSCYFDPNHLEGFFGGCIGAGILTLLAPIFVIAALLLVGCIIVLIGMIGWGFWLGCKEIYKCCMYCRIQYLKEYPPSNYGTIETNTDLEVNNDEFDEIPLE